jgi:hypothetical protein
MLHPGFFFKTTDKIQKIIPTYSKTGQPGSCLPFRTYNQVWPDNLISIYSANKFILGEMAVY